MKNKVTIAIATTVVLGAVALTVSSADALGIGNSATVNYPRGYSKLVFCDNFDVDGAPDSTKWAFERGYVRNGEMQYYTDGLNARCEGGHLVIEARADSAVVDGEARPVTSASVTTAGRQEWQYGYVEVRAALPSFRGSWPAIWMMPSGNKYGDWPRSGEIDIMEHVGYAPENVHFAAHCERYNHMRGVQNNCVVPAPDVTEGFHTYGFEWKPEYLAWYYDGDLKYTLPREKDADWTSWPFDSPFYLIINLAVGGGWGGQEGVDTTAMPQQYQIDYVRIFQ